jgi:hypothetical protein
MLRRDFLRQLGLGLAQAIPGAQSALSSLTVAAPAFPMQIGVPNFSPHKLLNPVLSMLFAASGYEQLLSPGGAPEKERALISFARMLAPLSTWNDGEHDVAADIYSNPLRVRSLLNAALQATTSSSRAVSAEDLAQSAKSRESDTNDLASLRARDADALELLKDLCSLCSDQAQAVSRMPAPSPGDKGMQALTKLIDSILAADWQGLRESPLLIATVRYTSGQFHSMTERARLESTLKEHGFEPAKMDCTSVPSFTHSTENAAARSVKTALHYLREVAPDDQKSAFPRIYGEDGWCELPPFIQRELWEVATLPAIPEATARSAKELLMEDPTEL